MLSKTIDKGALYSSMDVRLLEAFRAVVDHRSVTAAAGAMGVTQPAVSTQIARLEETIGFALFERSGGRLKPTPEGLLFYAEATRAGSPSPAIRGPPSRCCPGWWRTS